MVLLSIKVAVVTVSSSVNLIFILSIPSRGTSVGGAPVGGAAVGGAAVGGSGVGATGDAVGGGATAVGGGFVGAATGGGVDAHAATKTTARMSTII